MSPNHVRSGHASGGQGDPKRDQNAGVGRSPRRPGPAATVSTVSTVGDPEEIAILEDEREFLLASLRDLEHEREAADIEEGDYQTLHNDYTARAAEVLRALEAARRPAPAAPIDPETEPSGTTRGRSTPGGGAPPSRTRRTIVGATIVVVVAVAAGVGIVSFTGDRVGGDNVSGRASSQTARHAARAQQLEGEGKAAEALKEYDAAIAADASNVVALTYKGWLLGRAGIYDLALASLDKAIAVNPNYPDAHFFRGMVLYRGGSDPPGAVREFETYLASNPPPSAAEAVRGVLDKARTAAASPTPPAPDPVPPPAQPAPAAPPG